MERWGGTGGPDNMGNSRWKVATGIIGLAEIKRTIFMGYQRFLSL